MRHYSREWQRLQFVELLENAVLLLILLKQERRKGF